MEVASRPALIEEFSSALDKPVQLVLRAKTIVLNASATSAKNTTKGERGGNASVKVDFRKEATMPKVESKDK